MTSVQEIVLIAAGLVLFGLLLWAAWDDGRRRGRLDAYKRIGQDVRKERSR